MATKYTRIDINQDDIDRATRNNSGRCVVATAIARSIEGARKVSIDLQTIRFTVGDERYIYLTPPAASGYVVAFDAGDTLHPFAFRLSENHRVIARNDKLTPAAKARNRTRTRAFRAVKEMESAKDAAQETATPEAAKIAQARVKLAEAKAAEAIKEKAEVDKQMAGEPWWEPDTTPDPDTGQPKRYRPPQAYRRAVRTYGSRQLRINQKTRQTAEEKAARGAVTAAYDEYA